MGKIGRIIDIMKYSDLKVMSDKRLDDAKALYHSGRYQGSYYLLGYVVEMALKARICHLLNVDDYPDYGKYKQVYATHDFDVLLKMAGLEKEISLTKDASRFLAWSNATDWLPECRYDIKEKSKKEVGIRLVNVISILKWLKTVW